MLAPPARCGIVPRVTATVIDNPILNSPFAEPARHWVLDDNGIPTGVPAEGRRRGIGQQ